MWAECCASTGAGRVKFPAERRGVPFLVLPSGIVGLGFRVWGLGFWGLGFWGFGLLGFWAFFVLGF